MRIPQYTHTKPVVVKRNIQQLGEILLPNQRKMTGGGCIILENEQMVYRDTDKVIAQKIRQLKGLNDNNKVKTTKANKKNTSIKQYLKERLNTIKDVVVRH